MKFFSVIVIAFLVLSACTKKANVEIQAQKAYSQGLEYYNKGGESNLLQAIEYFSKSIEIDSNFALAYASLANTYSSIGGGYNILAPEETWPKAKEAAEKALALDKELPEAYSALAHVKIGYEWNWAGAEEEFKRALELKPNSVDILLEYAWFLNRINRPNEALALAEKAQESDPHSPPVTAYMNFHFGETEKTKQLVKKKLDSDPQNPYLHWRISVIYTKEGLYEEAEKHLIIQIPLMNGDVVDEVALLGHVYGRMGRKEEAMKQLVKLDELSEKGRYVSPVLKAWIYSGLSEKDEAIAWLQKGYENHAHRMGLGLISFNFLFEPIRNDPRFKELLQKMNLES